MKKYEIRFEFSHGYNAVTIDAESAEAAMEKAKTMDPHDAPFGDRYDLSFDAMESIAVQDEETGDEQLVHFEPETLVKIHAHDLLAAAQAVIDNWSSGDLAGAVSKLSEVVATATGGAT